MLWPNDIKEELSLAYVHALSARAGFATECIRKDRDSVDLKIMARGRLSPASTLESAELSVQLKATSRTLGNDDTLPFDLPRNNYDDLIKRVLVPRVLMVFVMPEDEERWLESTEDELLLRHCAYWICLRGSPPTTNEASKRIQIPRKNVVNIGTLKDLLTRVSCEQELLT